MNRFRTYDLAVDFYHKCQHTKLPGYLKNQLLRAASSCALNLMEGRGKRTITDQKRYFYNALGSMRECVAVYDLHPQLATNELKDLMDHICASIYKLIQQAS